MSSSRKNRISRQTVSRGVADSTRKDACTRPEADVSRRERRYDALVRAHSGELYRYAYWLCGQEALAQDLVQECLLRAWRGLDSLREKAAAKTWLITILRHEHARLYQRKAMQTIDIEEIELGDGIPGPEQVGEDAMLRGSIAKLDPKYREPLVMQVVGGYSCTEIADALKISEAAVMTQVFRARQKLRALLDGDAT